MNKILIVDDEPDILEFLKYNLEKEGYITQTAQNGVSGLKKAQEFLPNLIILDVMMPEMDGIETCRNLREIKALKQTLIVFLSARNEDYTQIAGFESGADDYIFKPIKIRVLVSKIKAILRRSYTEIENKIVINDLIIDKNNYSVTKDLKTIELPKKEFELLFYLASKSEKVISRDEIYKAIWGEQIIVGDRTIDVHIRKIREKIGDDLIKTIKGVGYKFKN